MASEEYKPRLSIEISYEQKKDLDRLLGHTHGLRRAVFSIIVDDLIRILKDKYGPDFLAMILNRNASLLEWIDIPEIKKEEEVEED